MYLVILKEWNFERKEHEKAHEKLASSLQKAFAAVKKTQ